MGLLPISEENSVFQEERLIRPTQIGHDLQFVSAENFGFSVSFNFNSFPLLHVNNLSYLGCIFRRIYPLTALLTFEKKKYRVALCNRVRSVRAFISFGSFRQVYSSATGGGG